MLIDSSAADLAEFLKDRKYADFHDRYLFVPLGFETVGGWGSQTLKFIRDVGRKIIASTKEPRAMAYLFQRLSIGIQRGNAASILGSVPPCRPLDEVFII